MATAAQVKALVDSHAAGDDARFYAVALQVAAKAARSGHGDVARELKDLVDDLRSRSPRRSGPTPVVQPRGELADLLTATYPDNHLNELALDPAVADRLARVVVEQRQRDALARHGFSPLRRLLLIGTPGTGKTLTAHALAGDLSLPLFVVRLESMMSKMLGETAAKLRLVFDAVADTRGVYLFDEVDALASDRGSANDVGEIRRVLSSFLQFLDADDSTSVLVATSNHPSLIDRAVFRRFDTVIEYGLPSVDVAELVLRNRLATMDTEGVDWEAVRRSCEGLSHADLAVAADTSAKDAILAGRTTVTAADLTRALEQRRNMPDRA